MILSAWPAPETTRAAWDLATTVAELAGTVLVVLAAAALAPLLLALVGRRRRVTPLPAPERLDLVTELDAREVSSGVDR